MEQNSKYFSEECVQAMNETYKFAKKKKYEFITVDSFMMFLVQNNKGQEIMEAMGLNVKHFIDAMAEFLEKNIPKTQSNETPQWTIQLRELRDQSVVLQRASGNKPKVDEGYIFVALFELNNGESFTRNYFDHFSVTRFDIMSFIAHNKRKDKTGDDKSSKDSAKNALHKYAVSLNKKAKDGKIDPIVGREKEIERAIEILCQRRKNNPILVGEPGVGKTAIAEGLAKRIVEGNVPDAIANFHIYNLDMPAVLAGTKYRGEFEERLKQIIKEASTDQNIVLVIDEIHTLIGTGSGSGTMDASNILKPALSSGEIKVIGATTYEEYRKYFEKEGALTRRFQKIDIEEPTPSQALEILRGIKSQYEEFHGVTYTDQALETAVQLSVKYMNDRRLPDKALDIIDTAGSKVKLAITNSNKVINEEKIKEIVATMARIPVDAVKETEKHKLKYLEPSLKSEVFGQDEAIEKTVNNILFSRSNLLSRDKPIGSFLFAGPSGVGKTELAKQLSAKLGVDFYRFDMSEYMEKHAVSRLVGAPPGYVGYEQGGQLTEAIRKKPNCVLLLDEIEKAHPDIFNILLQVMDYGTLTDNDGRKSDFKNVILIMTTNLGAAEISKAKIGFTKTDTVHKDREVQVKKHFSPEFYNRLDGVIQFNSLGLENIMKVIEKHTKKLQSALLEKKVVSIFTKEAMEVISKEGFDEKMGARPIERYIEKNISQILAKEILFGKLEQGGEIKIDQKDGKLDIQYLHCYSDDTKITKSISSEISMVEKSKPRKNAKKSLPPVTPI
jgi:ATP-dependent Clp protease ATP-binding subunit ClpA